MSLGLGINRPHVLNVFSVECESVVADAYFTAAGIIGDIEKKASCIFTNGIDTDGILAKNIFAYLISPQDINGTTYELKDPTNPDTRITWNGTDISSLHSVNGMKGTISNTNIGKPLFKIAAEFDNDNYGYTIYVNSFETGFKAAAGTFGKFSHHRVQPYGTATTVDWESGGGGFGLPHGGLVPHVYTFRRSNDGTRFNEHYVDGVLVGSRFDNPTDIIIPNPATDLRFGILAASGFGATVGAFFTDQRVAFVMIHDNLTAAETLKLSNRIFTLQANIITGGR